MHRAVATIAPPMERLHPDLKPAVQRALAFGDKYNRELAVFLDQFLEQQYRAHAGENLKRFRDSVDIMLGRKKRYDSKSLTYHFPNLAPIEFFERANFPWLDRIEAGTDAIRDEFLQILATEEGFVPISRIPTTCRRTSLPNSTIPRAGAHSTSTSWASWSRKTRPGAPPR